MSESMSAERKRETYRRLRDELERLLTDDLDGVAAMATCASVLHEGLAHASWTGFYRVVAPRLLRVGPYQGPVGCLEIPFERGVCGAAAREATAQVVPDVHAFAGHIACDAQTRSEIVVPILGPSGEVVAVLDIDSRQPAAFDDVDRAELERVADLLGPLLARSPG
jgi:GAF domain-containing protein